MKRLLRSLVAFATAAFFAGFVYLHIVRPHFRVEPLDVSPVVSVASPCTTDTDKLLAYINAERRSLGTGPLHTDETLVKAANLKADDMIAKRYYGHKLSDGSDPFTFVRALGVKAALSEELGINAESPEVDWQAFKGSPNHYASLINSNYSRIGIVARCGTYTVRQATGPDDNNYLIGRPVTELTVIELAD